MSCVGLGCKSSISWGEYVEILVVVLFKLKNVDDVIGLNFVVF